MKYKREHYLSEEERKQLRETIQTTKGMVRYGNRARAALCMPVDVAIAISKLSKLTGKSVSQIVVEILIANLPNLWDKILHLQDEQAKK